LGPDGQQFDAPVVVRLPFDPSLVPAGRSADEAVVFVSHAQGPWEALPNARVDLEAATVEGEVTHFSRFRPGLHPCREGATRTCYGGPPGTSGVGTCAAGVEICSQGAWSACVGEVLPAVEVCNGLDDDCDRSVDDDFSDSSCGVGLCARTVQACLAGAPQTCTPGAPTAETCNGLDDNCDSVPDDGLGSSSCGVGACQRTVQNCVGGVPQTCLPGNPSPEVCNGLDDNCNGAIDDFCT
jgi:hypothetical protein